MKGEYIPQSHTERNQGILRGWYGRWIWNMSCNFNLIREEFVQHRYRYSLGQWREYYKGTPAIIVGAGPSFRKAAPYLKNWKGAIFAAESMAMNCLRWKRKPEYICVFDAGNVSGYLAGINWKGSKLVTHPCVEEEMLKNWRWEKIYYLMNHIPTIDLNQMPVDQIIDHSIDKTRASKGKQKTELHKEILDLLKRSGTIQLLIKAISHNGLGLELFEHILPLLFPYVAVRVDNAGCVVNNAIQVAHFMGYDPIFLVGVDFGYKGNKIRADLVQPKQFLWWRWWKDIPTTEVSKETIKRELHQSKNEIITTAEQIEYKTALFAVWKLDKPQLFDCSDGIITELEKLDIKEVIEKNGRGFEKLYKGNEAIARIADGVLAGAERVPNERNVNREDQEVRRSDNVDGGQVSAEVAGVEPIGQGERISDRVDVQRSD